MTRGAAIKQ